MKKRIFVTARLLKQIPTASKVQEFFFTFMTAGRHGQTKSEETDV